MSIRPSPRYGVNPAIPLCFFCNKPKNEIVLPGRLKGDVEAPRNAVWDKRPCDECAKLMEIGVILISCKEPGPHGDHDNPYRTGGWCVVNDNAIRRLVPKELADDILKARVAFVPDEAWDLIGLPRGEVPGVPSSLDQLKEKPDAADKEEA